MENQEEAVMTFLTQEQAAEIDDLLTGSLGFTIDQLMELAGLSVASAVAEMESEFLNFVMVDLLLDRLAGECLFYGVYKPSENKRVLVICGPGNNGGDGLVAARHLHHFGYKPCVCYPKRTPKPLFSGLVTQVRYLKTCVIGKTYDVRISVSHSHEGCYMEGNQRLESLSVPFIPIECVPHELLNFDIIVDAIFGFSFQGNPRPPFDDLIHIMASLGEDYREHHKSPSIVSVDIPSGWHVENGDISGEGIIPHMLVSLTAPKLCAKTFCGPYHFIGGRFVPPSVVQKYKLKLPQYPGTSPCVRIAKVPQVDTKASTFHKFLEKNVEADPFVQFQIWFDDALAAGLKEPNVMALSTATKDGKPRLKEPNIRALSTATEDGKLSSRMVQLKEVGKRGFIWCSNYESRKGLEISENPHAAILFYWNALNRQVRIEGFVQKVSDEESEQYFCSRPREIQIAPAVSKQSMEVPGREYLRQQCKELEEKYPEGSMIPKPQHWGGYRLVPERFEFWQGDGSSVQIRLRYFAKDVDGEKEWRIMQ
ncbi:hypothetical protein OROHE_016060 [Orobanche hederae]